MRKSFLKCATEQSVFRRWAGKVFQILGALQQKLFLKVAVLALNVFNSVPLAETVRLGLVEFMTEIKGSDRLTKHLNT